jgi:hypothetical protein
MTPLTPIDPADLAKLFAMRSEMDALRDLNQAPKHSSAAATLTTSASVSADNTMLHAVRGAQFAQETIAALTWLASGTIAQDASTARFEVVNHVPTGNATEYTQTQMSTLHALCRSSHPSTIHRTRRSCHQLLQWLQPSSAQCWLMHRIGSQLRQEAVKTRHQHRASASAAEPMRNGCGSTRSGARYWLRLSDF